jgi:hypothetical protein
MLCQVKMIRPNGTRARHLGHYPNPGIAMDVVQAQHPDCTVNASVGTQRPTRSCDELGVCQSVTKACPPETICARKNSPFYFAPGTINAGSSDLQTDDAGWVLDTTWTDWAAAVLALMIIGAICGYLQ